jgi:hypothetical protein
VTDIKTYFRVEKKLDPVAADMDRILKIVESDVSC